MTKPPKPRAYLVSVSQRRQPTQVYALLAGSPDEALERVALAAMPKARLAIVGGLSRDLVKQMKLSPGELRLV